MAEAAQNSATPKPAIAQTTINCAREGLVKPDPLSQTHNCKPSGEGFKRSKPQLRAVMPFLTALRT